MDEERRKRMRRTTLEQLEEGRIHHVGSADVNEQATDSCGHSDEDFEFCSSDGEFISYSQTHFGLDFWEEEDYSDNEIGEDDVDPDELSYEELIALGEMVGMENKGLPEAELSKYLRPITSISSSHSLIDRCVICQVEYETGENLVALHCDHLYHRDCISKWLQINKTCPICNTDISFAETSKAKRT